MANFFDQYDAPPPGAAPTPEGFTGSRITVRPPGADQKPPAANYFDQYDVSVPEDMTKSAGIGLVKGTIGLLGLPADAGSLGARGMRAIQSGVEWALPSTATPPDASGETLTGVHLPGSADIRKGVEEVTGPLYEPKTRPGRYMQTAAEFVPGALAGPGGVIGNVAKFAVVPGIASEVAGEATHGTGYEPYARAAAAIGAGGIASMVGRPATASRAIRDQLPEYVTDIHVGQAEALIADAAQRGVQLTWPEALSQVVGRPVLTDMQRVLESAPRTRATMQDVHGGRPQEIATAAEHEFGHIAPTTNAPSTVGPAVGEAAQGTLTDVRGTINAASEPFYTAAAQVRLTPQEMSQVRALPGYAEAAAAVRNDPQLARYVAGMPEDSVGFLNEVKKQLDQAGQNARAPIGPHGAPNAQRAAGYEQDAASARGIGVNASQEYAVALAVQEQGRRRFLDPLLQGPLGRLADKDITTQRAIEALFPANPLFGSADEVSTAVSALAQRNPWAARQLVRAHLEQKLDEAFNAAGRGQEAAQFAGASFANRTLGSPVIGTQRMQNVRAAVEALPNGPQIWDGLSRFFEIAQATGTRQPIGSKTAFNENELRNLSGGSAVGNVAKTGLSPSKWMTWANDAWTKWQLGQNLDQLARIITDPNSGRLLQRIARAPRNSREAQLTAARVIAGANLSDADRRQKQP